MNDATKRVAEGWGFDQIDEIESLVKEDVQIDWLLLLLLIDQNRKVDKLMADVSGLETEINALTGAEEGIVSALNEVKNELSTLEAGNVSQETIDGLTAKVTNVVTALDAAAAPPTPPAEPPVEETPPAPPAE